MLDPTATRPDWNRLYETASGQCGYFTTQQAASDGYSTHLLRKHIHAGRVLRARRGIYRLVHFPVSEHEDLVALWLWSEQHGVVSHQTALAFHELSDVLPSRVHLTLPVAWQKRRLRVPPDVRLHYADLSAEDRTWFGAVPITAPRRTLNDCATAGFSLELLQQATRQALHRGLVRRDELGDVERALAPFGGLEA
ncbi:MAG: type IV toxin-antitoxin system AbiEi family antitoxin domain-containing protein [Polyangiaceae bacterium]